MKIRLLSMYALIALAARGQTPPTDGTWLLTSDSCNEKSLIRRDDLQVRLTFNGNKLIQSYTFPERKCTLTAPYSISSSPDNLTLTFIRPITATSSNCGTLTISKSSRTYAYKHKDNTLVLTSKNTETCDKGQIAELTLTRQ